MGQIHPDADAIHFSAHPDHRDIVRPFLTCFNVNRGFTKTRGNDELHCFYLGGEQFIAELIGLERELLLAYAPFPELQARAIKLHDEIIAEDRTRLDPIASIIVSDDPRTSTVVRDYLLRDMERAPIIGLSKQELASIHDANDVRRLLIQRLFNRNLFALESPLRTDTTFFGRSETVTQLLDRYRGGQNSGLFGLRRIGKTSVLYALARRAEKGEIASPIYLDLSSPGIYMRRWWELLQGIVEQLAKPLDLRRGERSHIRALSLAYEEKSAANHFKADVVRLADRLPGKRILMLLDEIEHITFDISPGEHWSKDFLPFWQTVRSVHQDTQGQLGFVIVGVNPRALEADRIGTYDNPIFSTTQPFYLGPFTVQAVREMVRRIGRFMGLACEESLYQRLFEEYGGHPFLVRQACRHLAERVAERPGRLTSALFERERKHIALLLNRNVRQILNVLAIWYPYEYEMIRLLAHGDRNTFAEFARGDSTFTQHVEGYGLVRDARGEPKLLLGLVRKHLAAVPATVELADPSDDEAVRVEVSRRRNVIEIRLREVLREGLRFAYGNKALVEILAALQQQRRLAMNQYSYSEIWKELYFRELKAIIVRNWDVLKKRFPVHKADMEKWLDQVNRCRVDAHAKILNSEDLAYLRVCFSRLEELMDLSGN